MLGSSTDPDRVGIHGGLLSRTGAQASGDRETSFETSLDTQSRFCVGSHGFQLRLLEDSLNLSCAAPRESLLSVYSLLDHSVLG